MDRRRFILAAGAGLASPFVSAGRASAAELTLKLRHAMPASASLHRLFLAPWASDVEKASGGQIAVEVVSAMLVDGPPPPLLDQLRDGAFDMIAAPAGAMAGRFPRLDALDLPFVAARSGLANSRAAQDFADRHAAADAPDLRVIAAWAEDHAVIHAEKPVATLADIKGLRLRAPTRLCGQALQALGAVAVSVRAAQASDALAQNVVDGALAPWDAVPAMKLHELTRFHTEFAGAPTLSTALSLLLMRRDRFEALPEPFRDLLLRLGGQAAARLAGASLEARRAEFIALAQARGNVVAPLAEVEKARWIEATKPVVAAWIEAAKRRGLDGAALVSEARATVARYEPPPPPPVSAAPPPSPAPAGPPVRTPASAAPSFQPAPLPPAPPSPLAPP